MNILLITKNYPPKICGVGDHSYHLKQEWEKMGHTVHVLTACARVKDLQVHSISKQELNNNIFSKINELLVQYSIQLIFWQYVPFSYERKGWPLWWPGVVKKLQRKGIRQAVYFHEVAHRVWGYGIRQTITALLQRYIANQVNNIVEAAFTSIALYQDNFRGRRPVLVPVGANLPEVNQPVVPNRLFCFSNRVDEALLDALVSLQETYTAELLVAGNSTSERMQQLQTWIDARPLKTEVRLLGELPAEELSGWLASSHIYIQPQIVERKNEGGISAKNGTIMAAMQAGKAIITCDGDMTDHGLFKTGENMVFVPYGNEAAYRKAIEELLADKKKSERLGLAAYDTWLRNAQWPLIAAQLLPAG